MITATEVPDGDGFRVSAVCPFHGDSGLRMAGHGPLVEAFPGTPH